MVEHMSDSQIEKLPRGGHDYRKVYAAFDAATKHTGQPTVILAHTIKGWTIDALEGKNATHQMKKLTLPDLKKFRDRLYLPISDRDLEESYEKTGGAPFFHPGADSPEIEYMLERRKALGGSIPRRVNRATALKLPGDELYAELKQGSGKNKFATTMAVVRLLRDWMKDPEIGDRLVPIAPDEYRTFGMDSMFPSAKVYNPGGQQYDSVDRKMLLSYKESAQGQMLHEGISEAGAMASATAAGSAYSTHGEHMIPFYIFYSMFGFQRTGDSIWAMADQLARGFLIGATAGRTTLTGEGLQHADGHSPLLAATNPAIVHYDPAFSYEISHIMQNGLERMYGTGGPDGTARTSSSTSPSTTSRSRCRPSRPTSTSRASCKGIHKVATAEGEGPRVQLMASGVGYPWIDEAARMLAEDWGVQSDLWSVTSWNELARDACRRRAVEPAQPRRGAPHGLRQRQARRRAGSGRRRVRLHARRPAADRPLGARPTTACSVPTGSASPTPARPPAASSTSTRVSVVVQALQALADAGEFPVEKVVEAARALQDRRPDRDQGHQAGGRRRLTVWTA